MTWVMPAGSKATSAPSGGAGHGRKGVGKGVPGATAKSKAQPKPKPQPKAADRAPAPPQHGKKQQNGASILATLGAVAKVLPLLETLGFGTGSGERGRDTKRSGKRAGKTPAAAGKGDGGWARSGRVPKILPKPIVLHQGKPALIVNLAGDEVPMVYVGIAIGGIALPIGLLASIAGKIEAQTLCPSRQSSSTGL